MDTKIIGQGYNLDADTSVAKELIDQFNSKRYDSFTCLVAFASFGGISALTPYILAEKERGVKVKIILGIDQKGTSKEALEEVLSWGVEAKIYHTQSVNIFHPKIYLFENTDIFTLIVGSNNLTTMGLVKNIECALLIKDTKGEHTVHNDFYVYWKSILDGVDVNLMPITQELIDELYAEKLIPTESERSSKYDNGKDPVRKHKSTIFSDGPIQKNPEGFLPKRIVRVKKKVKNEDNPVDTNDKSNEEFTIAVGNDVLLTEFSKSGDRWSQVNFPIKIFENYFGAEKGNNSNNVSFQYVANDGTLGEVKSRPSITVSSQNYRFELSCPETKQPYPSGNDRPIGIFIRVTPTDFLFRVLMPEEDRYQSIKDFLYRESKNTGKEMKRHIVHIEAIHALYPELVI